METTKSEKVWTEKCSITAFKIVSSQEPDKSMQIIEGSLLINELLSDYKQALREAVERHMGKVSGDVENAYVNGRTLALKRVLQLIETVTPKE